MEPSEDEGRATRESTSGLSSLRDVQNAIDLLRGRAREYAFQPIGEESTLGAAVLVPVYQLGEELHIIMTKRTETVQTNQGQISFPGGVREPEDRDLVATALRESWEEIGLSPDHVEVLCRIDDFSTRNGEFLIAGFIGLIHPSASPYPWIPAEAEVAEILEAPVSHLMDPVNIEVSPPRELNGRLWPNETFVYRGHRVFGATARALRNVLDLGFGS